MRCNDGNMLDVSGLSFGYGEKNNLECVDLFVKPGNSSHSWAPTVPERPL